MKVASGYYTKVNTCIKFFQKNMFSFRIIIHRFHTQFRVFDNKGVPMLTFRINVLTYVNTLQGSAKEKKKKTEIFVLQKFGIWCFYAWFLFLKFFQQLWNYDHYFSTTYWRPKKKQTRITQVHSENIKNAIKSLASTQECRFSFAKKLEINSSKNYRKISRGTIVINLRFKEF